MDKTVLVYIFKDDKVLLLYRNKKKNDLNEGKYVGIGGHIETNETKEEALLREAKEETNLTLLDYKYHAKIYFKDDDYEEIMYLFSSSNFIGELKECDEGELHWINVSEIFSLPMWEGDKYFLTPLMNKEAYFEISLLYSKGKLIEYKRINKGENYVN